MFQQREPVTVLEGIDCGGAVLEGITGLLANQGVVDADEIALVVSVEAVDNLHHVGVGNVTEGPVHPVSKESRSTERQVEAAAPGFAVEGGEVVTVAVELVGCERRDGLEEFPFVVDEFELDCAFGVVVERRDESLPIGAAPVAVADQRLSEVVSEPGDGNHSIVAKARCLDIERDWIEVRHTKQYE